VPSLFPISRRLDRFSSRLEFDGADLGLVSFAAGAEAHLTGKTGSVRGELWSWQSTFD
jgi:hypothetical protein